MLIIFGHLLTKPLLEKNFSTKLLYRSFSTVVVEYNITLVFIWMLGIMSDDLRVKN